MTREELHNLVESVGGNIDDLKYDYSDFKTEELCDEVCPSCGDEVEIMQNGKSNCSDCGHENVRPCSVCPLSDLSICDWSRSDGCTPFPNKS